MAKKVLPLFEKMLNEIGTAAGADVVVKKAPLKARGRAVKKAGDDYGEYECPNGGPAVGWVFDIVRGTLSCGSIESIKAVVALLIKDKRITITIKFKNRFKNPTPNGFCDMLLQVVFAENGLVHTCEIQVHLRPITEYAVKHKSHESYDYFRVLFQGSMNTVAARLKDMAAIVGPHFAPAEDGVAAAAVLEDVVVDVLESKDGGRLKQLGFLMSDYLSEFDLAVYAYRAELAVQIEETGPEHADVGGVYNNMAIALELQGKYDEALEMYHKALDIQVKALGPEHANVGATYNNIGEVFRRQGKNDDALAMFQKSLDIQVKALGPDHPNVGMTYGGIATVLEAQGKYKEAISMYQKSLGIAVKACGPDHPSVGLSYLNMGLVLEKQHEWTKALDCHERGLKIFQNSLGAEHPHTKQAIALVEYVRGKVA